MRIARFSGRLPIALALALLATAGGCRKSPHPPGINENAPVELLIPPTGAYTGAYIDFGDQEDEVTLDAIEEFETMVGKQQAIVASSSYWGEQTFPTRNLEIIWRHGSIPLVFWSPWDKPYDQNRGPDRFSLLEIIKGTWDQYIDQWADAARAFGQPMIVSFGNEMNGDWFPWSGTFYGGAKPAEGSPGEYEGPLTFKRAYRHVVDRVRARGAINIRWLFHTNNYAEPNDTWNYPAAYYPGSEYVDWLGLSVYGEQTPDSEWALLEPLIDWPYDQMTAVDPSKPIMVAEWGVGEFPKEGNKAEFIRAGFAMFPKYPNLKAAIYWNERWQNADDSYSNLRVNSSVEALRAYQRGVASPFWRERPILRTLGERR